MIYCFGLRHRSYENNPVVIETYPKKHFSIGDKVEYIPNEKLPAKSVPLHLLKKKEPYTIKSIHGGINLYTINIVLEELVT